MKGDSRSHGLWEASASAGPAAPVLQGQADVDVVVIGAGFTGLSAALHLAQGGASVAVLEAVDIGFGGSGRNVGLVNAGMWVMPEALPGELGPLHGRRLLELLGKGPSLVYDSIEQLAKKRMSAGAMSVGIERTLSRAEFKQQRRHLQNKASQLRGERNHHERLPA